MSIAEKIKQGEELFLAGRKDEAEALFKEILAQDSGQVRALNNLAVIAMLNGRVAEAEEALTAALRFEPDDLRTLSNWLDFNLRQQRWFQAAEAAEAVLAKLPNEVKVLKAAAKAELALGDYSRARSKVACLLDINPDDFETLELSAFIHLRADMKEEAEKELERLLAAKPERADLAGKLALLKNPQALLERDLWPDPTKGEPLEVSQKYHEFWGKINTTDPMRRAAHVLGRLANPSDGDNLTDIGLPQPFELPDGLAPPKLPQKSEDIAGLSIMFAPTIIAGQSPIMARWLNKQKVKTTNVAISRNYLGYKADYFYPENLGSTKTQDFVDLMMEKAKKCDILCMDFGSSFTYFPNFVPRLDLRRTKVEGQPYAELLPLKDKGVKIFFQFWGSDSQNQSLVPYLYLTMLGFDNIPSPPVQTRFQYQNVKAANEIADAILCFRVFGDGIPSLPRIVPHFDVCFEPEVWPMKPKYRSKVEKILTAPTNPRKKNYSLIQGALEKFTSRHPAVQTFRVSNTPHDKLAPLFAEADLGIDQATPSFGVLAVEMMAMGLPVITFMGPRYHHNSRGLAPILHFSNNIREMEIRLEECIQNPDRLQELGQRGRDYAMEYHSINAMGPVFSGVMAEAASNGNVSHDIFPAYERLSRIWDMEPEEVYCFKFYDVAVPLFCALGEYEYGLFLSLDALDCNYRVEKFMAWIQAIEVVYGVGAPPFHQIPETESLFRLRGEYIKKLKDGRALLEEYESMLKEAEALKQNGASAGIMPDWSRDLEVD